MTLRSVPPAGVFRARGTRDAQARERDGMTIMLINELQAEGEFVFEVLSRDGVWILASSADIDPILAGPLI